MEPNSNDVAILGGGFNPIGLHHEGMAQLVRGRFHMPTWIMPCYGHRFEKDVELINHSHRWNMVTEAASQSDGWLVPCDWEIAHRHNGSMFETMEHLTEANPTTRFHLVIGMDNAKMIEQWDRGLQLIRLYPFIVLNRPGVDVAAWCCHKPHTIWTYDCPISSTKIRAAIKTGRYDFAKKHLNTRVWDYIRLGKLYGYEGN